MKYGNIEYTRQYHVKDLYTFKSFIQDAASIEFTTFGALATYLPYIYEDTGVGRIIVPVSSKEEVEALANLKADMRPFLTIYLKDFSKEVRDAITEETLGNSAILVDSSDVKVLRDACLEEPSPEFIKYLSRRRNYFRDSISREDIDSIIFKYTDPYLAFPFFNIADISWDWESFESMPCSDIMKVMWHLRHIKYNLRSTRAGQNHVNGDTYLERSVYLPSLGAEKDEEDRRRDNVWTSIDIRRDRNLKELICDEDGIYLRGDEENSRVNFNQMNEEYLDFDKLNKLRTPYDIRVPFTVHHTSMISLAQNRKCTSSYVIPSELCKFVCMEFGGYND